METKVYHGEFECREDVERRFAVELDNSIEILFAGYDTPWYEGYAFVLFEQDGKLYEVNGSHCSCYGLEGQWDPEETTWRDIKYRLENGHRFEERWGDVEPLVLSRFN